MKNYSIQNDLKSIEANSKIALGNSFIHGLTLFWIVGVILFDKAFAYISVGPIYITEFTMSAMILYNFRRLKFSDVFLIGTVVFYIIGGIIAGHDPFFSVRDMAWLYYLLFIRFFPRNFPTKYINFVILACWMKIFLLILYPILGAFSPAQFNKYLEGILILFLYSLTSLSKRKQSVSLLSSVFFTFLSIIAYYKTLIFVVILLPILLPLRKSISKIHSRTGILVLCTIVLFTIQQGGINKTMFLLIDGLNFAMDFVGSGTSFTTGTARWRGEIWRFALFLANFLATTL
jgi:hypothetical protein